MKEKSKIIIHTFLVRLIKNLFFPVEEFKRKGALDLNDFQRSGVIYL